MRRRARWIAAAGVAGILGVTTMMSTAAQSRPQTPEEKARTEAEVRARSPRQTTPAPPLIIGYFINGEARTVRLRSEIVEIDTPQGKVSERNTVSSQAEMLAQIPPQDARFIGVGPTPAQIEEIEAKTHAEQEKVNAENPTP